MKFFRRKIVCLEEIHVHVHIAWDHAYKNGNGVISHSPGNEKQRRHAHRTVDHQRVDEVGQVVDEEHREQRGGQQPQGQRQGCLLAELDESQLPRGHPEDGGDEEEEDEVGVLGDEAQGVLDIERHVALDELGELGREGGRGGEGRGERGRMERWVGRMEG